MAKVQRSSPSQLFFACFMVIAIIGLLIFLLGQLVPLWASALIWAGVFLIILAILGLIGYKKVKAQLPFAPESAIFGVLFDLGVLREGSAMTASRLKQEQAERAARKQAEREAAAEKARQEAEERKARGEEEPKPLTIEQIQQRTKERRAHLAALRDDMQKYRTECSILHPINRRLRKDRCAERAQQRGYRWAQHGQQRIQA